MWALNVAQAFLRRVGRPVEMRFFGFPRSARFDPADIGTEFTCDDGGSFDKNLSQSEVASGPGFCRFLEFLPAAKPVRGSGLVRFIDHRIKRTTEAIGKAAALPLARSRIARQAPASPTIAGGINS